MTLNRISHFIGEVARPYCLIAIGTSTAWSIFDGKDAAVIGAAGLILAGLYGARAFENGYQAKKAADVEVARSGGDRREPLPVTIENPPGDPVPVEEAHPVKGD